MLILQQLNKDFDDVIDDGYH